MMLWLLYEVFHVNLYCMEQIWWRIVASGIHCKAKSKLDKNFMNIIALLKPVWKFYIVFALVMCDMKCFVLLPTMIIPYQIITMQNNYYTFWIMLVTHVAQFKSLTNIPHCETLIICIITYSPNHAVD